jgi:hypothetical protein
MCATNPLYTFEVPPERMEAANNIIARVGKNNLLTLEQLVDVLTEMGFATAIDFAEGQLQIHELTDLQTVGLAAALAMVLQTGGKMVNNPNLVLSQ